MESLDRYLRKMIKNQKNSDLDKKIIKNLLDEDVSLDQKPSKKAKDKETINKLKAKKTAGTDNLDSRGQVYEIKSRVSEKTSKKIKTNQ